jgi:DNA-binding response OmpR family regulator
MTGTAPSILLVEDDNLLRHALRLLLEDAGYRIIEAGSAAQALEHAGGEAPPALVVLDLGLPDRTGLEVAREMRENPAVSTVPIIALTGRAGIVERRACLDAGCTDYFAKPLEPRELLQRVAEILQ